VANYVHQGHATVTCGKSMLLCFLFYSSSVILCSHPLSDSGNHRSVVLASENGAVYSRKKINIFFLLFSPFPKR